MNRRLQRNLNACGIGLIGVGLLAAAAEIPGLAVVGYVFAPGIFLAGMLFSGGHHSDWAIIFLLVSLGANALLLGWALLFFWDRMDGFRGPEV